MTKYPKSGKGNKWTNNELKAITSSWNSFTLNDGESLVGTVYVTSAKTVSIKFRYGYKRGQKKHWHYCGTYPDTSISEIREERDRARSVHKQGIDPKTEKKASKIEAQKIKQAIIEANEKEQSENLTLDALFMEWEKEGINHQDKNESIKLRYNKHLRSSIGKIPLKNLNEKDLIKVYKATVASGKNRTAVVLSNIVKQMLSWAEKRKPWRSLLIDGNPSLLVNMDIILPSDYEEERTRVLSEEELIKLNKIFKKMKYDYVNAKEKYSVPKPMQDETILALWISLGTLSRSGELLMAEWKHVSWKDKTWFIPKENVKGRKNKKQDHTIFLSDFVLKQMKKLFQLTGKTQWLFPSLDKKSHVDVKSMSKQVGDRQLQFKNRTKLLNNRANSNALVIGDDDWSPHDMRRTGATMMQSLQVPLDTIDRCQNHILAGGKIRKNYLLYDYQKEMKLAWSKLGKKLEKIIN